MQRELTRNIAIEVAYNGSKITHVGIPDTNLNQLTVEQLALGATHRARGQSVLRHHPAILVARRSDDSRCASY